MTEPVHVQTSATLWIWIHSWQNPGCTPADLRAKGFLLHNYSMLFMKPYCISRSSADGHQSKILLEVLGPRNEPETLTSVFLCVFKAQPPHIHQLCPNVSTKDTRGFSQLNPRGKNPGSLNWS